MLDQYGGARRAIISNHYRHGIQPAKRIARRGRRGHSSAELLCVFWPFFRPYRWRITGAALALLMVAGALLTMGRGLAYLVDEGLGRQDPELLNGAVIGTAMIAFVLAAGSYLRTTLVNQIGESVLADVRRAVFGHLMTLPPAWYERPAPVMCWPVSQPIRRLFRRC